MKKKILCGSLAFAVLFLAGWGFLSLIKPLYLREEGLPSAVNPGSPGSVSEVAAMVSPSIVGITNLNGGIMDQTRNGNSGSGVILDQDGNIVTNYHVVQGAERLIVALADGSQKEARMIGADPRTDLALIKIEKSSELKPASLGDSDGLQVGQQVVAIGNPLGLQFARSVTAGVVSGLNRLLTSEEGFASRLIQTDAAINPGNSGGALVDLNGRVVGINTVKIAAQGFEGMGFSIPSNQVRQVVQQLQSNGRVSRPILGIRILGELNANQASYYELPADHGVVVEPASGGPAARAGMVDYDIITAIDGQAVVNGSELQEKILAKRIGDTVKVSFMRLTNQGVKTLEINVQLSD